MYDGAHTIAKHAGISRTTGRTRPIGVLKG